MSTETADFAEFGPAAGIGAAVGTCASQTPFGALCGEPAIGQFSRICVHEHVRTGPLCRRHAESKDGSCLHCWELPIGHSHLCPIHLAEVTP